MQFTVDVRRALVRADGRPMFFVGSIRDIDRAADSYVVTFDTNTPGTGPSIQFRLQCDSEPIDAALKEGFRRRFAVIAAVSDVRMTRDDPGPIATGLNRQYIASGECLFLDRLQ